MLEIAVLIVFILRIMGFVMQSRAGLSTPLWYLLFLRRGFAL